MFGRNRVTREQVAEWMEERLAEWKVEIIAVLERRLDMIAHQTDRRTERIPEMVDEAVTERWKTYGPAPQDEPVEVA